MLWSLEAYIFVYPCFTLRGIMIATILHTFLQEQSVLLPHTVFLYSLVSISFKCELGEACVGSQTLMQSSLAALPHLGLQYRRWLSAG